MPTTPTMTARIRPILPLLALLTACPQPSPPGDDDDGESDSSSDSDDSGDVHDPLSMPAEPTLDPAAFHSAALCAVCHPTHYEEWQDSRHARSMRDPVFRALVAIRQQELDGREDQFCSQCHSAICTRGGECVPGFDFAALSPIALEGVTCESCHKVAALERPYNSGHVLDPEGPIRGPVFDPVANNFHTSQGEPLLEQAEFCGGCHDVIETSGLELERPYQEWLESPANPEQPCQDCHMPTYTGVAGPGGPNRVLHRHRFVGVDLPMEQDVDAERLAAIDQEIEALLATAASLSLSLDPSVAAGSQLDVHLTVENLISGHSFPTGSTFLRQVWVELSVRDGADNLLYHTGGLDEQDDLGNYWSTVAPYSDPDLIMFGSALIGGHGSPELFSWRAAEHSSTALSPLHQRTFTLFVPVPADAVGPLSVDAALHFRVYPPFLLRLLGLDELVDLAVVRDIAVASAQVDVNG